jgi:2-methylcitrate dehydratase PrpD
VDWAYGLDLEDVPAEAVRAAKRQILDAIGCAVATARTDSAPYALGLASEPGPATILGYGRRAPVEGAAFANGVLMHALDFDDTHAGALIHPSAAMLPALLAVADTEKLDGRRFMELAVVGYETGIRIGAAVPQGFHARGFHATPIAGVFASALAVALALGATPEEATAAMGIAGSMAAGSLEFLHTGSSTKQLHAGLANRAGIEAVALALAGASGPASILEGDFGLYSSYTGTDVAVDAICAGLGEKWECSQIITKPYPLCQLSHASLDALRGLLPLDPDRIESIHVVVPSASIPIVLEPAERKVAPSTEYEAKFSLQWCMAALAIDGAVTVDTFAGLDREDIQRLAALVSYSSDDRGMPAADHPGIVTVNTDRGERQSSVERSMGGPTTPLSDDALVAKFAANCAEAVADPGSLADSILALETHSSVSDILAAVSTGPS